MKVGNYLLNLALKGKLDKGFIIRYRGLHYEFVSFDDFLAYDFDHFFSDMSVDKIQVYEKVSLH